MRVPRWRVVAGAGAAALALSLASTTASALAEGHAHHVKAHIRGHGLKGHGTVVSVEASPYGPVLVVGGDGAGYDPSSERADPKGYLYPAGSSLYAASIDPPAFGSPYVAGCDATTVATSLLGGGGTGTCTGSETDSTADWPALTTDEPPVAGRGVIPWLLGRVYRADLGTYQVTYAGHPLYLFDPGPGSYGGLRFFETVGPAVFPWHTAWYLVSPDGNFNAGRANLSVLGPAPGVTYTGKVLATEMLPNIGLPGGVPVVVYTFSGDKPWQSNCYGDCAREFIPVLTIGDVTAEPGVDSGLVGVTLRKDGTLQVTYRGHPLYIYNQEQPLPLSMTDVQSVGNGAGVTGFGGTLAVIHP